MSLIGLLQSQYNLKYHSILIVERVITLEVCDSQLINCFLKMLMCIDQTIHKQCINIMIFYLKFLTQVDLYNGQYVIYISRQLHFSIIIKNLKLCIHNLICTSKV